LVNMTSAITIPTPPMIAPLANSSIFLLNNILAQLFYIKKSIQIVRGKHSPQTIAKMRLSHTGITHSEETKRKFRDLRNGAGNAMYGRHHSPESIEKMKIAALRTRMKRLNADG